MLFFNRFKNEKIIFITLFILLINSNCLYSQTIETPINISYQYDSNGSITSISDENNNIIFYQYDNIDRLTSIEYSDGVYSGISIKYDINGNISVMNDKFGKTQYKYDFYDRLTEIYYPNSAFIKYEYDNVNNIVGLKYGNVNDYFSSNQKYTYIKYTYNKNRQIIAVKNIFKSQITTYSYDDFGNIIKRTLPNGVYSTYTYDDDGRLIQVSHYKKDDSLICSFRYTFSDTGQIAEVTEKNLKKSITTLYEYDLLNRLILADYNGNRVVKYKYDSFGNRLQEIQTLNGKTVTIDYSYDNDNRLISIKMNGELQKVFYYDFAGNLNHVDNHKDNSVTIYKYDHKNQLILFNDGLNSVECEYDGFGKRISKIVNGVKTYFVNDPNQRNFKTLAEMSVDGKVQNTFEWGNEIISQTIDDYENEYYYLHDYFNGNVRRIIDKSGSIVNSYEYDAFGNIIEKDENAPNVYQFHGEVYDVHTKMIYLRTRYYSPQIGRFITQDSFSGYLTYPSSLNSYVFVNNNPVNYRDPQGKFLEHLDIILENVEILREHYDVIKYMISAASVGVGSYKGYKQGGWKKALSEGAITGINELVGFTKVGKLIKFSKAVNDFDNNKITSMNFSKKYLKFVNTNKELSLLFKMHELTKSIKENKKTSISNKKSEQINQSGIDVLIDGMPDSLPKGTAGNNVDVWIGDPPQNTSSRPGGISLDKTATVLLNINEITGGAYDTNTGQIILYGKEDKSSMALPKISIDDLSVASNAIKNNVVPVVSIEDPIVYYRGRDCLTVRYGPFVMNEITRKKEVYDVSSKTHFGWVMFEADRIMKCLSIGLDNITESPVSSNVEGYYNSLDLIAQQQYYEGYVKNRFWFSPKDIVIEPSEDGKSMKIKKVEMQVLTETMYSSNGQVETTKDAEFFASWFTENYDAIADEQITFDKDNNPHYIFKELKQLAAIVGIVRWFKENNIPIDIDYEPEYFESASYYTPMISRSETYESGTRYIKITGGVTLLSDFIKNFEGNPEELATEAIMARPEENDITWSFTSKNEKYNAGALSMNKDQDGNCTYTEIDAFFKVNGKFPLLLSRYYNSFDIKPTIFGWNWKVQPYSLEMKTGKSSYEFSDNQIKCFGQINFYDFINDTVHSFFPAGLYDIIENALGIASRFEYNENITVYRNENNDVPGVLLTDNHSLMIMRLANGFILEFDCKGSLQCIEDPNKNVIKYTYNENGLLTKICQPDIRMITFVYDIHDKIIKANLPGDHVISYNYDSNQNLKNCYFDTYEEPMHQYNYDNKHHLIEVLDSEGNALLTRSYDNYGRVVKMSQPDIQSDFIIDYSLSDKATRITDQNSFSQTLKFNDKYDLTSLTNSNDISMNLKYNTFRDLVSKTIADAYTESYFYDYRGNQMAIVYPNGRADVIFYDINNNPMVAFHSIVDDDFKNSFDSENILTSSKMKELAVDLTVFEYDKNGNLTKITDASNNTNTFEYDSFGNLIKIINSYNINILYKYDKYSRLISIIKEPEYVIEIEYDEMDNVIKLSNKKDIVEFAYNDKNNLNSITYGQTKTKYQYNAKGQISQVIDPNEVITNYIYDKRGNLIQIMHDGFLRWRYEYDNHNRLIAKYYTGYTGFKKGLNILRPVKDDIIKGDVLIQWDLNGDWKDTSIVTIQYSVNRGIWHDIASVDARSEEYLWQTGILSEKVVRIRFICQGDNELLTTQSEIFSVYNGDSFYINDSETGGDEYCNSKGRKFDGKTITGTSPDDPVDNIQDIINNYKLIAGSTIYIDTGEYNITKSIIITEYSSGINDNPVTFTGPDNGKAVIRKANDSNDSILNSSCIALINLNNIMKMLPENISSGLNMGDFLAMLPNDVMPFLLEEIVAMLPDDIASTLPDDISTITNIDEILAMLPDEAITTIFQNILESNKKTEWITIKNLRITGGREGIILFGVNNSIIQNNICYKNGVNGQIDEITDIGSGGTGAGIAIFNSENNIVENNECYSNGGNGSDARTSMIGWPGEGVGIMVNSSINTIIKNNKCVDNWGEGGKAKQDFRIVLHGDSNACGIKIVTSEKTSLIDNIIYENDAMGKAGQVISGSDGFCCGIKLSQNKQSYISGNILHDNDCIGGNSKMKSGGDATASVILASFESDLTINGNIIYNNQAIAGSTDDDDKYDSPGDGNMSGIMLDNCFDSTIKNNLIYDNFASSGQHSFGTKPAQTTSFGIRLSNSKQVNIYNNTVYNNWGKVYNTYSDTLYCSQIAIDENSTFCTVKNNICESDLDVSVLIYVNEDSQLGFISNYNNFNNNNKGLLGLWGETICVDLKTWQSVSNLDYNSLSVESGFIQNNRIPLHLGHDSLLIDAGETLGSTTQDIDNEERLPDKFDIGCDEYTDKDNDSLIDVFEKLIYLSNPQLIDSDGDRLPDAWEVYYGLNPNDNSGSNGLNGDPDKDGYVNGIEFIYSSQPTNYNSTPDFSINDDKNGTFQLSDAITVLQVLSKKKTSSAYLKFDMNNDQKIGLEEVIFLLNDSNF